MTQKQLAEFLGTTPTTLSKYENGQSYINQYVIDKIQKEYGETIRPVKYVGTKKKSVWRSV